MSRRLAVLWFAVSWIVHLAGPATATERNRETPDPFSLDGARNIMDEAHFGIVNGKLTSGIPFRSALSVKGLWAPPYVSSDFGLGIMLMEQPVATERYTWHPFHVDRVGSIQGIAVETVTMLIPGSRAGLVAITLKNSATEQRMVPVAITVGGTLDRVERWEFATPASKTVATRKIVDGSLTLRQADQAIVLRAISGIRWDDSQPTGRGSISLPPSGTVKLYVVFAIGPTAEAQAACEKIAADPEKAMADTRTAYAERLRDLFQNIPQLESSNPALERFYYRSLVHLITNRWDVPEFVLHPNYTTGSVNGGCVCNYLWDFGEPWEMFPLFDPEASRTHIKKFLATDMTKHFSFDPIAGKAWGPWYPANQEKIVGLIYYYVKNTGDTAFLNDTVDGKTVLEHAVANAMYGDDPAKPVTLIDYGPSNNHLELRRGFPYNHVMPDLNGRRYENYMMASQLAELAGKPVPRFARRAEELRIELKKTLWNAQARWFDFQNDKGRKDTRYTVQVFKLFGSKVLDTEQEAGLLGHLNSEKEFLSDFGLHSMSKTDVAYDQADIDNGGGGSYNSFPPQIAERLYKAGHPDAAENILKRILWWGDRVPYWGDSFVANRIDYRKDTPLQCDIGGVAGAQAVIFGMFGIRVELDGRIRINPHPPAFSPKMKLTGLRLRGHVLDIAVNGKEYEVREGEKRLSAAVGQPIIVQGDQLAYGDAAGCEHGGTARDDLSRLAERLQPAARDSGFRMKGYFVWCGSVIKVDKTYHMFAARWPEATGFPEGYRTHSEIVRATADKPEGPYAFQEVVIAKRPAGKWDSAMAHNPAIYRVGGAFVLYYNASDEGSRYRQIGIATAPSVTGPWTRSDRPLDLGVTSDANNPAALVEPDGSVKLIWRDRELRVFISMADSFRGPYRVVNDNVWPACQIEDFYFFKYNGQYHVVCEDSTSGVTGHDDWGAHLISDNGIDGWRKADPPFVYTKDIRWDDGAVFHPKRRERPWFLEVDGKFTCLFNSIYDGKNTWSQPVPIRPALTIHP